MDKFKEYKLNIWEKEKKLIREYLEKIQNYIAENNIDSELYNDINETNRCFKIWIIKILFRGFLLFILELFNVMELVNNIFPKKLDFFVKKL